MNNSQPGSNDTAINGNANWISANLIIISSISLP